MVNKEELDILKDKMVNLYTVSSDTSLNDISVESNVLLFQVKNDSSGNPEYVMYRGYNDGSIIGISATSALKLKNPINIFGNPFDGTGEITSIKNADSINTSGNIIAGGDISGYNLFLQNNIDASSATFKQILVDTSNGSGFIIDSANNKIDISILNVNEIVGKNITADSLNVNKLTFKEMTADNASFNNISVTEKLDASNIHLGTSILTYSFIDENGIPHDASIDFAEGLINFNVQSIIVTYEDVDKLFQDYEDGSLYRPDGSKDGILYGTTYFVKQGLKSNETFTLHFSDENDEKGILIPNTPYLVLDSSTSINDQLEIKEKLKKFNYDKAGTMIFQNVYPADAKENYIDVPESTNIEDGTAITGSEYHRLWKAVKQIQYVLGIDMDAGNTGNTTEPDISLFGLSDIDVPTDAYDISVTGIDSGELTTSKTGEWDPSIYINTYGQDATDSSIDGVILTNLYVNQKTAYTNSETEEKPAFLQAIDDLESEVNGDENTEGDIVEDDNNGETPTIPDVSYIPGEDTIITDTPDYDITNISKYFVRAIRIKRGTYSQLMDVSTYILDGELIWCKYDKNYPAQSNKLFIKTNGNFYCINTGTDEDSEGDYLTELKDIEKIDWKTDNGSTYRTVVDNDGNMHMQPLSDNTEIIVDSGKKRSKFYINSFYFGGLDSSKLSFRPCSHNFIELSNLTGKDINLEDAKLSLQYTDRTKYNAATGKVTWEILPLKGTIKSGETFLIRGAQCGPLNCNTTRIEIDSYDMEWYDSTGKLISFDTACPSIVLYKGNVDSNGNYATCTAEVDDIWEAKYLYSGTASRSGVYDCIGVTGKVNGVLNAVDPLYFENTSVKPTYESIKNTYDVLFVKYFTMDNCAQGTIAEGSRNNTKDIYLINLNQDFEYKLEEFYPGKASYKHKNIFYNKSDIGNTPEMIACSFGKQASDNENGATRCFNWVSRGYYNEYLELIYPDGSKKYYESFKNSNQENIYTGQEKEDFTCEVNEHERFHYKGIYDRYRTFTTSGTPITVHKLIIDGIPAGSYKYRIGKKGFWSDEYSFIIRTDEELIENGFTFIHHSDQQGFNKNEYIAWKHAADFIDLKYGDKIDFTVNTGDMTQNGNRISEWLDYYDAGKTLFKHTCQMNTVGNNDLSPQDNTVLGTGSDDSKINPKNFDLFYCHDLTVAEQDLLTFELADHSFNLLPACYSVNYGNLHLVCINSEVTWLTIERLFNNHDLATKVEEWLDKDFKDITNYNATVAFEDKKWIITYCHEMPFTILTQEVLTSTKREDRSEVRGKSAGCHWNYIPSLYQDGTKHYYWLSRLLEKYHVPLMLGGHKHTYSTSARIKENIKSESDYSNTYKPIIQLIRDDLKAVYGDLDDNALKLAWYTTGQKMNTVDYPDIFDRNICDVNDIEIVDEFDAPMYVMTQATGYKVISNKENAGRVIPWLTIPVGNAAANTDAHSQTYYPVTVALKVNSGQLYPTFIVWNISKNKIVGLPMKMSTTVDAKTSQIYYTGNKSADGLFRLVNQTDYNLDEMDSWNPDNVDGMSARKELILTNKPF